MVVTWPGPGGPSALDREGRWGGDEAGASALVSGGQDPPRSSGRVVEVVVTWPGPGGPCVLESTGGRVVDVVAGSTALVSRRGGRVVDVVTGWPGPSALEREGGGGGGGDVAGSGWTLRARIDRWEGGGCGGRVQVDPPLLSGRVVQVER